MRGLTGAGCEVVCLDNFFTGLPLSVAHLIADPAFRLVRCDVTNAVHVPGPVRRIAEDVLRVTGSRWHMQYFERPVDDRQRRPDTALAGEVLGWQPKVAWLDGLARAVAWFRKQVPHAAVMPDSAAPRAGRVKDGVGVPR